MLYVPHTILCEYDALHMPSNSISFISKENIELNDVALTSALECAVCTTFIVERTFVLKFKDIESTRV